MATRIIVGLSLLLAVVETLAPGALLSSMVVMMALAILGLLYGHMAIDAEDATGYLAVTIAVGAASGMEVLSNIPAVGSYLDGIMKMVSVVLYAGVASILVKRVKARVGW
jgi:hypothetical protein